LEVICFAIIFRNNHFQQTSYINSSRTIAGSLYAKKHKMVSYVGLKRVNDSLAAENARLKNKLSVQVTPNPLKDTTYTLSITEDSIHKNVNYTYMPAKVINNSVDQKVNYITLDIGSKQGVRKNMAVINDKGIVGKISHVSENYSVALSVLSERFNVSAMVKDGTVGKIAWDGKDPEFVTLTGIPQSVKIKPLDSVFTSGYGYSIFPEKILIGRAAKSLNGTSYKVWLSTQFTNLHYVYVIAEETNIERQKLEESIQEEQ
jgi:rod shape-determining protein MreC